MQHREGGRIMQPEKAIKVYVCVEVSFESSGRMKPQVITWEDGRKFEIDKVSEVRPAPALRAGGQGDRYTVWIGGKQSYLFFEHNTNTAGCNVGRWFVERRAA